MRLKRSAPRSQGGDCAVQPVSPTEYGSWAAGALPELEEVADGIWAVPVPYGSGRIAFTFAYLVEDRRGGVHVIDPGWDSEDNVQVFVDALSGIGRRGRALESIIVTHLHADHLGLARRLRSRWGVPVHMHEQDILAQGQYVRWAEDEEFIRGCLDVWAVPAARREEIVVPALSTPRKLVPADYRLEDGNLLSVPGRRLRAIHTPGHTPGHVCIHDEDEGLLFTGDHLLPRMTPGLGVSGYSEENPLREYFQSLTRVCDYSDCQSLPGHEFRFHGIVSRASQLARRHLGRMAEVEHRLLEHPRLTVWQIAERLSWGRGWAALSQHNLVAALRQTAMHAEMIRSGAHHQVFEQWGWGGRENLPETAR